ncbi:MAG: hypothetical protein WBD40_18440 [Tepidisphaeraceae bacterium]
MRNKPFVAALAVPGVLLLIWAISLWWNDNNVMSLIPGGLAAALFFAAYRVAHAASFSPDKKPAWDARRSESVQRWADAQSDDSDQPAARS